MNMEQKQITAMIKTAEKQKQRSWAEKREPLLMIPVEELQKQSGIPQIL